MHPLHTPVPTRASVRTCVDCGFGAPQIGTNGVSSCALSSR
jgi:hypothetical protein